MDRGQFMLDSDWQPEDCHLEGGIFLVDYSFLFWFPYGRISWNKSLRNRSPQTVETVGDVLRKALNMLLHEGGDFFLGILN